jgi:hypothetical protein
MLAEHGIQSPRMGRPRFADWLFHPVVAVVFVLLAYFFPDLLSQFENSDGKVHFDVGTIDLLIFFAGLLIFVGEVIGIIISTTRLDVGRSIAHLIALLVLSSTLILGKDERYLVQLVNVYAFAGRYETCAQSATPYDGSGRFKLCSILADDNAYTMVIYDSGGQIVGPRSQSFRDFLSATQSQALSGCRIAPVKTLRDHFYFVQSDCESRPE